MRIGARIREAAILLIACRNTGALVPVEADLERMSVTTPEFAPIRDALLAALADGVADPLATVADACGADPVELLSRVPQARAHPLARAGQPEERVREVLSEAIQRHAAALAYEAELAEARRELGETHDEAWTHRVRRASAELERLERELLAQGPVSDAEGPSRIQTMLDNQVYRSKKR